MGVITSRSDRFTLQRRHQPHPLVTDWMVVRICDKLSILSPWENNFLEQIVRCIIITGSSDMGYKHVANFVCKFMNVPIRLKQLVLLSVHSRMLWSFALKLFVSVTLSLRITFLTDKITNHVSAQTGLWLENLKRRPWRRWKDNITKDIKGPITLSFHTVLSS